jgi:hypothetical protein
MQLQSCLHALLSWVRLPQYQSEGVVSYDRCATLSGCGRLMLSQLSPQLLAPSNSSLDRGLGTTPGVWVSHQPCPMLQDTAHYNMDGRVDTAHPSPYLQHCGMWGEEAPRYRAACTKQAT